MCRRRDRARGARRAVRPRRRRANAYLVGLTALAAGCAAQDSALRAFVAAQKPAVVAIAYHDLETGRERFVNADVVMHAASTMKIPVMIEAFRRADAGELVLDKEIVLRNEFKSIVDGSPYSLQPEDDSDTELYAHIGKPITIRELVRRMIESSSNLATNVLIDLLDAKRVQATIERLGTTRMRVLRGVEDGKAYRAGLYNTATAKDLMVLLYAIAVNRAASPRSCEAMREFLFAQKFNDMIPEGLPPGTFVAHKTGSITGIHHDAAIVYPRTGPPYVLVVFTKGFTDEHESARVIRDAATLVHATR
jgi:beta-lactamase class A